MRSFFKVENGIWMTMLFIIFFGLGIKLEAELLKNSGNQVPDQVNIPSTANPTENNQAEDSHVSYGEKDANTVIKIPVGLKAEVSNLSNEQLSSRIEQNQLDDQELAMWLALTKEYIREENTEDATKILKTLIKKYPDDRDVQFQQARLYTALEQPSDAIALYEKIIKQYPNHQSSYINLGLLLTQSQQYSRSNEVLIKAVDISASEKRAKAWSMLGTNFQLQKAYDQAEKSFLESVSLRPNDASTWRKLAVVQLLNGQSKKSIETFNNAIALSPAYLLARLDRLRAADFSGLTIKDSYRQLARDFPDSLLAQEWLAFHYLKTERMKSLERVAKSLYKQVQSKSNKQLWSAVSSISKKQNAKAIKKLKRASQNNEWVNVYLAYAYLEKNQFDDAKTNLEKIREPFWIIPYRDEQIIWSFIKRGDIEQAQKRLDVYKQTAVATHWLPIEIELLRERSQHSQAVKLFEQLFASGYETYSLKRDYAFSLRKSGYSTKASDVYKQLRKEKPTFKKLQLDLARSYYESENIAAAMQELDDLITRAPHYLTAVLQKLNWLKSDEQWQAIISTSVEAIPFYPDSIKLRTYLFNALVAMNDSRANEEATRLIKLEPKDEDLNWQLFNVLRENNEFNAALTAWAGISEQRKLKHSARLFNMGLAARKSKETDYAIKIFQLTLKYKPSNERAKNYIKELKSG